MALRNNYSIIAQLIALWLAVLHNGFTKGEIYIPSRGRSGAIHQFYDQRVQTLRPYMLVNVDQSMRNIASNAHGGSTLKRTVTKSFSEYVEQLEIAGEAKVDLLLNIFEGGLRSQGSFTSFERGTTSSILAFVEIIQYTREEKVNLCDPTWMKHLQLQLLDHIQATHVIKGKRYGLYLEIVLEIEEKDDESNSNLDVEVQAELETFLAQIDTNVKANKTSLSKKHLSKSKILTYCNLVNCPTPPQSLEQLELFIKDSYAALVLDPEAQGNEISLIADDIKSLTECWNVTNTEFHNRTKSHEISGQNVNYIESVMREVEQGVATIYKFQKKMLQFKECIPASIILDIQHSSDAAMSFANIFKGKLKRFVIYVRFGKRNQDTLAKKLKQFRSNEQNPKVTLERLNYDYSNWIKKVEFYSSILKTGMRCLPSKQNLLTMYESSTHLAQVFYLMSNQSLQDNDGFIAKLPAFANVCSQNCTCYIVDCFFDFSFCKSFESNQILKYYQGILTLANNSLITTTDEYKMIQQAILFLYIHDSKTVEILSLLNDKIDMYLNGTHGKSITKNAIFNNMSSLFKHDSIGRQRIQRTKQNPVEKLLRQFIDIAE